MYAVPSSKTFGVKKYTPLADRTYPSDSRVSSSRRTVGRANFVAAATSLTLSAKCDNEKALITFKPRASASTKSGSVGGRFMMISPPQLWHKVGQVQERSHSHDTKQ
jgi:hypothetical protein